MKCPKCQIDNVPDAKFCEGCGTKLVAPAAPAPQAAVPNACPSCGNPLKPGARFCGSCGAAIGGTTPVPGPAYAPPPTAAPRAPAPGPYVPPPAAAPVGYPQVPQYAGSVGMAAPRKGRGCLVPIVVAIVILAGLGYGGWTVWTRTVLSNPMVLVGKWKATQNAKVVGEVFVFEPVEGGVKVLPESGQAPMDIVLKPSAPAEFKGRITNPSDASQWADITVKVNHPGSIRISFDLSDGTKDAVDAVRAGV
ncbi:MAG: zinc ribbon domain-containing protein [Fimbriimonadaceae bacterium]|nr:zinc ribbon domain-containing protein [Fimbriimonadaceae bacterium]